MRELRPRKDGHLPDFIQIEMQRPGQDLVSLLLEPTHITPERCRLGRVD
jgi:hypothetical protein